MNGSARKQIFLLQGPLGSFFEVLSKRLQASGYSVLDVCFNLGDRLNRSADDLLWFSGSPEQWRVKLRALCDLHRPQCFILFGDRRPIHVVACEIAAEFDIKVYSFEEGYLRPDFVTCEPHGNNARSLAVRQLPYFVPAGIQAGPRPVGKTFGRMICHAIVYQWALAFNTLIAPRHKHHRQRRVVPEALYWTRAWARKLFHARADRRNEARLKAAHGKRFFILALQVHDDLQSLHHGAGWTQERLIETAIHSFGRHAPKDTVLVIRYHPMDRGHKTYAPLVNRIASAAGVQSRVCLMFNGHAPTLLTEAAGFISVNSTMALSAMHHGCPVLALGDCFYRIPGLAAPGRDEAAMDAFWSAPPEIDHDLFMRFRALLIEETQINGSYYQPRFYPAMAVGVIARLRRSGIVGRYNAAHAELPAFLPAPLAAAVPAE